MATPTQIAAVFAAMNAFNDVSKRAQDADTRATGYTAQAATFTTQAADSIAIRNGLVPEIQQRLAELNAAMAAAGL